MSAFSACGPCRRRAPGARLPVSRPAVSQHLRVLREHGFASVRPEGTRRLYAVQPEGPREASQWLSAFERFWRPRLDALGTELARGKRNRRLASERDSGEHSPEDPSSKER